MKAITRFGLSAAALAAASLIAACSSGSSGMTPNTQIGSSENAVLSSSGLAHAGGHGKARLVIRIPLKKKIGRGMHPEYISPSTKSLVLSVRGGASHTFNLTPSSKDCKKSGTADYLTCQEGLILPVGQRTLTVTLYDQTGGKGAQLSTATTSVNIAKTGFTPISIVLGGVVAKATVLIGGSAAVTVPVGTPTSVPVTVEAYDADGNLIVPPGDYSSPITLTNADRSGVTSFTAPGAPARHTAVQKTKPMDATTAGGPGATAMLYYNGNGGASFQTTVTPSVKATAQPSGAATLTTTGTPTITEYSFPETGGREPYYITTGSDGALWFSEAGRYPLGLSGSASYGWIGRITTSGVIQNIEFQATLPGGSQQVSVADERGLTAGPDGALWFDDWGSNRIARITTAGAGKLYNLPTSDSDPWGITTGPDGALWFAESLASQIGKITTSGAITEYSIGFIGSNRGEPFNIVAGPDHALWFTDPGTGEIGRVTTDGSLTEYPIMSATVCPSGCTEPESITVGPDGALWFTDLSTDAVGRMTTGGSATEYQLPAGSAPISITAGPDGALWVLDGGANNVARITTAGTVTGGYPIPTGGANNGSGITGTITTGPDGAIWFTEFNKNQIGRLP